MPSTASAPAQLLVTPEHPDAAPRAIVWWLTLASVLVVSAIYVWLHLRQGWIPFDDGTVAQSADRVLQGQLPHRDFDDLYTGGLTLLNAAAFRILGTNLWTLRLVLFAFCLAWIPALFYIASRFARPFASAGVVLLAVVWSLPNYPAAMASWYNLFFATFGLAALLRYLDVERRRWLVLAGVAGGLSFLVKVIGLYYVAGALLFFVFHAHAVSRAAAAERTAAPGRAYVVFVSGALAAFVVVLFSLVRHQLHAPELVHYFMPGALLAMLLIRNEWAQPAGASGDRFRTLAQLIVPFLVGVVIPIAVFLIPYARDGTIGAVFNGVFIVPTRRFNFVYVPALPLWTMLALVPFGLLGVLVHRAGGRIGRRGTVLLVLLLLFVLRATDGNAPLYRSIWYAARSVLPVLAVCAVVLLYRISNTTTDTILTRSRMLAVVSIAVLCSIVQFPYSLSLYFCYAAPLVVLTTIALYRQVRPRNQIVPGLLTAFFIAFAVLRTNTTRIASLGAWYQPQLPVASLALERGGIRVPKTDAVMYDSIVTLLHAHARGGYTWASPDSPEIYFLAALENPTRTLFEVFDDASNTSASMLRTLDAHGVTAVVLSAPAFSPPISPEMFAQLAARYPHSQYVGPFQVRWRD
jgi:hypothetical protein